MNQKASKTAAPKQEQVGSAAATGGVVDTDKQVVKPASTAVSTMNFGELSERKGVGLEDADRDSFALPFLVILQKMSPQLDRNDPEYLPEAREGDILNTATRTVYNGDEGILVANVSFKRSFTEWGLREKGGGYKGEFSPSDPVVTTTKPDEKKRNILPGGATQLVDTRMHAVILLGGEIPAPALMTMTSTQIKKSKRWMTSMDEMQKKDNLPTFAHVYKLTTISESNDQGSWMGWKVEYQAPVTEQEHIDAALAFYRALRSGLAQMKADAKTGPAE